MRIRLPLFIRKKIKFRKTKNKLQKGETLKLTVKVKDSYLKKNGIEKVKVLLNTEAHKQMLKYKMELCYKYKIEYNCSANSLGLKEILIELKKQ